MPFVHTVDSHLNKSELVPPSPVEIAKLAERSRKVRPDHPSIVEQHTLPRSIKRRLTSEARAAILVRHKAGETVKALSKQFAISESALRDLLVTADVEFRKHPITHEDIDLAVQLYQSGLTVKQIVNRLYYPIGTIRRVLRERGVVMRPPGTTLRSGNE